VGLPPIVTEEPQFIRWVSLVYDMLTGGVELELVEEKTRSEAGLSRLKEKPSMLKYIPEKAVPRLIMTFGATIWFDGRLNVNRIPASPFLDTHSTLERVCFKPG
jgi:hypothetical protein